MDEEVGVVVEEMVDAHLGCLYREGGDKVMEGVLLGRRLEECLVGCDG